MNRRKCVVILVASMLAAGCSVPFRTSTAERKAQCDSMAAQAIQTSNLQNAANLAAQASECYSQLIG